MNPYMRNSGYGFQRPKFGDAMKAFFSQKTVLNYLLIANIGVWLLVLLVGLVGMLFKVEGGNVLVNWLSLPASLDVLAKRPWSMITYMVLHQRFWQLFINMWMLYFGGMIFVRLLSEKQLLLTYILGGLVGAIFFLLSYNLFPALMDVRENTIIIGASASVLAILVAAAAYNPDYELGLMLFGRMKFKWLAVIFIVIDVLSINPENPGLQIAHLGGVAYGFVYGLLLRKAPVVGNQSRSKKREQKYEYTSYEEVREEPCPRSDEEYNQQKAQKERDIDAILDKVAKNGYTSLTDEEKAFLFKNS